MAYKIKKLSEKDFKTSKWSGGETTQMYIYPEWSSYKDMDFKFRISSATIQLEESDFTKLEGVYRYITTLENNLRLTHDFKVYTELEPFQIYEFEGDIKTHSYGKVVDFNLMLENGVNGSLESLYIDNEKTIKLISKSDIKSFHIFYSYNADIKVSIDLEEIQAQKGELLIIESTESIEAKLSTPSNSKDFVLYINIE
ncbi:MAG: HutD family protein [Gudongella sp.]|nr:HutD family protein [Gudongella sp.]